jgi:tetratricopeptide (TPR) repeat protein
MLAKQGRQFQREAKNHWDKDEAVDRYEQALNSFEEALALVPEHADALAGEKEVKEALEQLHERTGDQLAQEGRRDVPNRPAMAAQKMLEALDHYQEAQAIDPFSPTLPPKIEALQKELPPLLVALGQQEQQQAAKAEPQSTDNAIAHLEKASTSYERAEELDKDNQQAQQGQEQVQKDLARLREQQARKAEQAQQAQQSQQQSQQQNQQQQNSQQAQQNFQSLLSQVKDPEKQKEYEAGRRGNAQKYDPQDRRIHKNW